MNHTRFLTGLVLATALLAPSAFGQVQRTFVSGMGSDSNPCSRTAPCRTFGQAISQTNAGGEVYVLDTAGYGPVAITKSVAIVAPQGVTAGISVFSGDGIDINAGSSDTVILRGLTINNQGSTGSGIVFNTGGTLHLENCVVSGFFNFDGVFFRGPGTLEVKDSIMRGNAGGIRVNPSSGTALAAIEQVRLEGNLAFGLQVGAGSKVTVRNSLASGNQLGLGFVAFSDAAAAAELNVENCVASNNFGGIIAQRSSTGAVTVRVSNSTVTDNTIGLSTDSTTASLLSRSNNTVEGNGTDGSFTGTYSAK